MIHANGMQTMIVNQRRVVRTAKSLGETLHVDHTNQSRHLISFLPCLESHAPPPPNRDRILEIEHRQRSLNHGVYSDFIHLRFPLGSGGLCHAWEGASRRWRLGYTLYPHVAIVTVIKNLPGYFLFPGPRGGARREAVLE